jgi:hypothetical protein
MTQSRNIIFTRKDQVELFSGEMDSHLEQSIQSTEKEKKRGKHAN